MKNLAILTFGLSALIACGSSISSSEPVGKTNDGTPLYRDLVEVNGSQQKIQELASNSTQSVPILQSKINGKCAAGQAKFHSYGEWKYLPASDGAFVVVFYTCE